MQNTCEGVAADSEGESFIDFHRALQNVLVSSIAYRMARLMIWTCLLVFFGFEGRT